MWETISLIACQIEYENGFPESCAILDSAFDPSLSFRYRAAWAARANGSISCWPDGLSLGGCLPPGNHDERSRRFSWSYGNGLVPGGGWYRGGYGVHSRLLNDLRCPGGKWGIIVVGGAGPAFRTLPKPARCRTAEGTDALSSPHTPARQCDQYRILFQPGRSDRQSGLRCGGIEPPLRCACSRIVGWSNCSLR